MKILVILSLMAFSSLAMAFEDKCYNSAKKAAFNAVKDNEEVITLEDFGNKYGDESVDVIRHKGWQEEYWSFSNPSSIINVEIHALKGKCFVKKVDFSQNDQDWE